jgi:hypothetical protein
VNLNHSHSECEGEALRALPEEGATRAPVNLNHSHSECEGEALRALPEEGATRAPVNLNHSHSECEGEALRALPEEGATRAPVIDPTTFSVVWNKIDYIVDQIGQKVLYSTQSFVTALARDLGQTFLDVEDASGRCQRRYHDER